MNYLRMTSGLWFPEPVYNLPGTIAGPGLRSGTAIDLKFLVTSTVDAPGTTTTFLSMSFGVPDALRYVLVGLGFSDNGAPEVTADSMTIGGVSATRLLQANDTAGGTDTCELWYALLPTGTSGDVVVTFSEAGLRAAAVTYRLVGISSITPFASAIDIVPTADTFSMSHNVPAGGVDLGIAYWRGTSTNTDATWSNLTEDFNIDPESNNSDFSGASDAFAAAQTPLAVSVSATAGGITFGGGIAASWSPAP